MIDVSDCKSRQCETFTGKDGTYYMAEECNAPFSSFEEVMAVQSGRNFSIAWFYLDSHNCPYPPYAIEAIAVDSCEGVEVIHCSHGRIQTCMYIDSQWFLEPQSSPGPTEPQSSLVPSQNPPPNKTAEVTLKNSDEDQYLSTLEQVLIAVTVCGWAYAMLSTVLYVKQRARLNRNGPQAYTQLTPLDQSNDPSWEKPLPIKPSSWSRP